MIANNDLEKFIIIYKKYYGISLNRDEAYKKSETLLKLVETVYKKPNNLQKIE